MVSNMRNVFSISLYRRMASVTISSACILCAIPHEGICLAFNENESIEFIQGMLTGIEDRDTCLLLEKFDELEESMNSFEDPLDEGRKFLQSFIEEINLKYGLKLTVHDACVIVRENLHTLQLPEDIQNVVMSTIELMESDCEPTPEQFQNFELATHLKSKKSVSWPWHWKWFGLNKKKPKPDSSLYVHKKTHSSSPEQEIPGSVCAGAAEVLAGAIACILGTVFPPAYALGVGLMLDGTNRMINGAQEMDKQRETASNGSSNPLEINF